MSYIISRERKTMWRVRNFVWLNKTKNKASLSRLMSIWKALQAGKMSVFITLVLYHGLDKDALRYGWKTQFCLLPLTTQLRPSFELKISLNLMWTFLHKEGSLGNFIKWDWMRCFVHILWCPWPGQYTLFTHRLHNEVEALFGGASLYSSN